MMSGTQGGIRQARAGADQNDWHLVITDINSNLLQRAVGKERGDRIADWPHSLRSKASSHAYHVGLSHAAVEETVRKLRPVFIEQSVSNVTHQQDDPFVAGCQIKDLLGKGVSHICLKVLGEAEFLESAC
jgi:hypothetical protein